MYFYVLITFAKRSLAVPVPVLRTTKQLALLQRAGPIDSYYYITLFFLIVASTQSSGTTGSVVKASDKESCYVISMGKVGLFDMSIAVSKHLYGALPIGVTASLAGIVLLTKQHDGLQSCVYLASN